MQKKKYQKPSMKVYELVKSPRLLVGSGGDMSYIPGQPVDVRQNSNKFGSVLT